MAGSVVQVGPEKWWLRVFTGQPRRVGSRDALPRRRSTEPGHHRQYLIDAPHFVMREMSDQIAEPTDVDDSELFDKHSSRLSFDMGLGSKRRWAGALGRRRHDHDRTRQELVRLDDDAVTIAMLRVANASRETEANDITSAHEAPTSAPRRQASRHGQRRLPLVPRPQRPAPCSGANDASTRGEPNEWPLTGSGQSLPVLAARYLLRRPSEPRSLVPCAGCVTLGLG